MNPTKSNKIPAYQLDLQGLHLIEASAGTGKTWTLTALLLRMIVQGKKEPRQIIATTFTRAAAAELRTRIRARMEDLRTLYDRQAHLQLLADPDQRAAAQAAFLAHVAQDQFYDYLFKHIHSADEQQHARNRLQLALDSFDELFVGTLDSFCQKLLSEFAFDSGQGERRKISEQEGQLRLEILHDALRRWRSSQDPRLIELMVLTGKLSNTETHAFDLETVMNFLSAKIDPVPLPEIDFNQLTQLMKTILLIREEDYQPFFSPTGAYFAGFKGKIENNAESFGRLIDQLNRFGVQALMSLKEPMPEYRLIEGLAKFDGQIRVGEVGEQIKVKMPKLNGFGLLTQLFAAQTQLIAQLKQVDLSLKYTLSQALREQLPIALAERGETSFSQQMRLLADALSDGEQGQLLAKQIQHRYPVALIDEFQDTNADQDRVVAQIYRQQIDPKSCLILVGDPKQAIYGFRGGDVQTYLNARRHVEALGGTVHHLTENHRSVAPLVAAVDHLLSALDDMGEGVMYTPIAAGTRPHPRLVDASGENVQPLRWLELDKDAFYAQQVAWQIADILAQAQAGELFLLSADGLSKRAILPEDIAVLAYKNKQLDPVQTVLQHLAVPVWRPSRSSVFKSPIAEDLLALMRVMLMPYHEGRLRRALSGPLVGQTLQDLEAQNQQPEGFSLQQAAFAQEGQLWHRQGFLAAWNRIAERLQVWQVLAQQAEAERHLVNLRHLLDVLHAQSERLAGPHHLLVWLQQNVQKPQERDWEMERRLPSQSGVQMMTIHGSKGLEFPLVFALGLDARSNKKESVLVYSNAQQQRQLSFYHDDPDLINQHHARNEGEARRLAYVAMTRASHRLYVHVVRDAENKKTNQYEAPIRSWLCAPVDDFLQQQRSHPNPLDGTPQPLSQSLSQLSARQRVLTLAPARYAQQHAKVDALQAPESVQRRSSGWGQTSFSALIRGHDAHAHAALIAPRDASAIAAVSAASADAPLHNDRDDEHVLSVAPSELLTPADAASASVAARFLFSGGTNSGNCLHKILEYLDPNDAAKWPETFKKQMEKHAIAPIDDALMTAWFDDILHAPLPMGATLAGLGFRDRVREMPFHFALPHGSLRQRDFLARLAQDGIVVAPLRSSEQVAFLIGSMDLVYQHQHKFYVADYKSNWLGKTLADYQTAALQQAMTDHSYWLQAVIYLLVLHRYLRVRLPNYQIEQHLGGACYLFLRGMQRDQPQQGILHWQPNAQLILDLDQILGGKHV